jgi:hypothetical protein
MKKPWVAGVLNCIPIPMGLGYIYLGDWNRFWFVFPTQITLGVLSKLQPAVSAGLFVLWVMSIHDAVRQARIRNGQLAMKVSNQNEPGVPHARRDHP